MADEPKNALMSLGPTGALISPFSSTPSEDFTGDGTYTFSLPWQAIQNGSEVDVSDIGNGLVRRISLADGSLIGAFTNVPANFNPRGLARNPADGDIAVADDQSSGRIDIFSPTGSYLKAYNTTGPSLAGPTGVAFDANGNLFIADEGNNRVVELDANGGFVQSFGTTGSQEGGINTPTAVAVDAFGNLWVTDPPNNRVEQFDSTGHLLAVISTANGSGDPLSAPNGVAVSPGNGDLWVADTFNNRVVRYTIPAPGATTDAATNVTATSATLNGTVNTEYGPTWCHFEYRVIGSGKAGINATNTVSDCSSGFNWAQSVDVSLQSGQSYEFRLVVSRPDGSGLADGTWTPVGSPPPANAVAPSVTTGNVYSSSPSDLLLPGQVNPSGTDTTYWFQYGFDPSSLTKYLPANPQSPLPKQDLGSGSVAVPVSDDLTGLQPGTTIYYQLFAKSAAGQTSGSILHATTPSPPVAVIDGPVSVSTGDIVLEAEVNPEGYPTTWYVAYGTDPQHPTSYLPANPPGSPPGSDLKHSDFISHVLNNSATTPYLDIGGGLRPGTRYCFQLVAISQVGPSTSGTPSCYATASAPPNVSTEPVFSKSSTRLVLEGHVDPNGSDTFWWFRYGNDPNSMPNLVPDPAGTDAGNGTTSEPVSANTGTLAPGQTVYYQLYATAGGTTTYGDILHATVPLPPVPVIDGVLSSRADELVLKAEINPEGQTTTYHIEYGKQGENFGSSYPPYSDASFTPQGTISQLIDPSPDITGLAPDTEYCFRLVASNVAGSRDSDPFCASTPAPPTVQTEQPDAGGIGVDRIYLKAEVNPGGARTTWYFQYSTQPDLSGAQSAPVIPGVIDTDLNGTHGVLGAAYGLTPGQTYYYRLVAQNAAGIVYDDPHKQTVQTLSTPVETLTASAMTAYAARLSAQVANPLPNRTFDVTFEYGTTPDYGSTTKVVTNRSFTSGHLVTWGLAKLLPSTTYHFRPVLMAADGGASYVGVDHTFATPAATLRGSCVNGITTTGYELCDAPDLDQERLGQLPDDGADYCVPTSAMDAMAYIAKHVDANIPPGAEDPAAQSNFADMSAEIKQMGGYMQTNVNGSGTPESGLITGIDIWLAQNDINLRNDLTVSGFDSDVTVSALRDAANSGDLILLSIGFYDAQGNRGGGHEVFLSGISGSGDSATIDISDPDTPLVADDIQSPFVANEMTARMGTLGDGRKLPILDGYAVINPGFTPAIDGFVAIAPTSVASAAADGITISQPVTLVPGAQSTTTVNTGGSATSLSLTGGGALVDYLVPGVHGAADGGAAATGGVLGELDRTTRRVHILAHGLHAPRALVIGGARQLRYVLDAGGVTAFDGNGRRVAQLPGAAAGIAWDAKAARLGILNARSRRLTLFSSTLRQRLTYALPARVLAGLRAGGLADLAFTPAGAAVVHVRGTRRFFVLTLPTRRRGRRSATRVSTRAVPLPGAAGSLSVDDAGLVLAQIGAGTRGFTLAGRAVAAALPPAAARSRTVAVLGSVNPLPPGQPGRFIDTPPNLAG